jgi:hypothetical protein
MQELGVKHAAENPMPEEPIENPYNRWFDGPIFNSVTQKAMAPEGGVNGEGFVVMQSFIGAPSQRWRAQHLADDHYRILHPSSGKVLDVAGASTQHGARVICWPWHGGDNQQFKLRYASEIGLHMYAKHSGKDLTAAIMDNAPVLHGFTSDSIYGTWNVLGRIVRSAMHKDFCWVLQKEPAKNGTGLSMQVTSAADRTLWVQFQHVPPYGPYRIAAPAYRTNDEPDGHPKVLDIEGASTANGARVILWDWHGGKNQLFAIGPSGEIRAEHSLKAIQIGGPDRNTGWGHLEQWDYSGDAFQRWLF